MPTISESVTINADVEDVFDLISRVEEFPRYASMLKEVREIGHRTYRWEARVQGLTLTWDSIIAEFHRPTRLAWRSIRGFKNSGTYRLSATPNGTRVELTIPYNFEGGLLDGLMGVLTIPLARTAAAAILAKVRDRLEHPTSQSRRRNTRIADGRGRRTPLPKDRIRVSVPRAALQHPPHRAFSRPQATSKLGRNASMTAGANGGAS